MPQDRLSAKKPLPSVHIWMSREDEAEMKAPVQPPSTRRSSLRTRRRSAHSSAELPPPPLVYTSTAQVVYGTPASGSGGHCACNQSLMTFPLETAALESRPNGHPVAWQEPSFEELLSSRRRRATNRERHRTERMREAYADLLAVLPSSGGRGESWTKLDVLRGACSRIRELQIQLDFEHEERTVDVCPASERTFS